VTVIHTHVHKIPLPEGTEVFQTSHKEATCSPCSSISTILMVRASIIQQGDLSFFGSKFKTVSKLHKIP